MLLWAGTWIGVGYAFSDAVTVIAARVEKLGLWLVVVALLGAYVVSKFLRRRLYFGDSACRPFHRKRSTPTRTSSALRRPLIFTRSVQLTFLLVDTRILNRLALGERKTDREPDQPHGHLGEDGWPTTPPGPG